MCLETLLFLFSLTSGSINTQRDVCIIVFLTLAVWSRPLFLQIFRELRLRVLWPPSKFIVVQDLECRSSHFISGRKGKRYCVLLCLRQFMQTVLVCVLRHLSHSRSHAAILKFPNEKFYEGELQVHANPIITHSYCSWSELVTQVRSHQAIFESLCYLMSLWNNWVVSCSGFPSSFMESVEKMSGKKGALHFSTELRLMWW